jgi:hypothetical protein
MLPLVPVTVNGYTSMGKDASAAIVTGNHPYVPGPAEKELGFAVSPDGSPEIETAIVPCHVLPTSGIALMLATNELPGVIRGVSGMAWRKNCVIGGGCCFDWLLDPPQLPSINESETTATTRIVLGIQWLHGFSRCLSPTPSSTSRRCDPIAMAPPPTPLTTALTDSG